jgi:SAM-dependent methyltransferase
MQDLGQLTKDYFPREWTALEVLGELAVLPQAKIADLGCGTGRMYERLRLVCPRLDYIGIDIEHSAEVKSRERDDIHFVTFDGIHIPYPDQHFDVVFSNQVFEHVRHQEELLREIRRVLRKDGWFVGSLSGLEPFHSNSIFNLTPYGWLRVLNESGFAVQTIRPGVDCTSLISRQYESKAGTPPPSISGNIYDDITALCISDVGKSRLMLHFAGHIVFAARRLHI